MNAPSTAPKLSDLFRDLHDPRDPVVHDIMVRVCGGPNAPFVNLWHEYVAKYGGTPPLGLNLYARSIAGQHFNPWAPRAKKALARLKKAGLA